MQKACVACKPSVLWMRLTPRERDVAAHVVLGTPNKVIAAELGVSRRTIEAHRARIFRKLRVRNAVELVRRLLQDEGGGGRAASAGSEEISGSAGRGAAY